MIRINKARYLINNSFLIIVQNLAEYLNFLTANIDNFQLLLKKEQKENLVGFYCNSIKKL